jgi:hypothetical protein
MSRLREVLEEALATGARADFRARGTSMSPTIGDGDVVTVCRAAVEDLRVGDIVTFWRAGELILHRVIETDVREGDRPQFFRTAGDGNLQEDGFQKGDALLGRVVLVRSAGGEWSPQEPLRRLSGRLRVTLACHPRLRTALRAIKSRVRSLGLLRGREVPV